MQVAFGKISITPKDYIGKSLAGYTRKEACSGKLDDLYGYSILIECSSPSKKNTYLLLISIDLLKIPLSITDYIKKKIRKSHPYLKKEQILIHATHTHAGFDLTGEFFWPGGFLSVLRGIIFGMNRNDKYIVWFSNKISMMVNNLFEKLEPCTFSWKKTPFNPNLVFNRRHPERDIYPYLSVIAFKSLESNNIIGIIINYSCHPTTLSYKNSKLSADFIGQINKKITQLTNRKIKSLYINSASGDLNPITTYHTNVEIEGNIKGEVYDQLGTYENTKEIGYKIAKAALELAKSIPDKDYLNLIEFAIAFKEFWIPMKDLKYFSKKWLINKFVFVIKKLFLLNIAKYQIVKANFPIFLLSYRCINFKCKTIVQYVRLKTDSKMELKDLSIITIPGELFFAIGKSLLNASPSGFANTLLFQNTQDWIAYLFTLKEYIEEGGYEVTPSFSPLCGYFIEKEILKLMSKNE